MISALDIHVTGIVQGVGFRPFVYRQARKNLINGWVLNSADGVHIHAEGEDNNLDSFCLALANDAPASANVAQVEMKEVPLEQYSDFEIRFSKDENMSNSNDSNTTLISADLATCSDCVKELFDVKDRRYRYPFINCTNCGPRFTIIDELPYDRDKTSMNEFNMCHECAHEYSDPADRRFHAQPDACFECGPKVSWSEDCGKTVKWGNDIKTSDEIFHRAVEFLNAGKILAIKGLGGFHLACDATNKQAVENLRRRKLRSNKAFAIMANSIESIQKIAFVNKVEQETLMGCEAPIVLLKQKNNLSDAKESHIKLAENVTCGLDEVGVMLPNTPVQHILMHDFCQAGGDYLVMTSGNLYENPIVTDDLQAYEILGSVADAFLGNNRKILTRYDDSVLRVLGNINAIQMIRRARGFAPVPIKLNVGDSHFISCVPKNNKNKTSTIFAAGTEQKNTCSFLRVSEDNNNNQKAEIFVSQHIGDLENLQVMDSWNSAKTRMEKLFRFNVDKIVFDKHPEYLSTKWAEQQDIKNECKLSVQHHFAHIAGVMAENDLQGPVAGFAFDGTGYGEDGYIWGGEVLICNNQDFERFANFCYVPMPGISACISNPLQMAFGCLYNFDLLDHPIAKKIFENNENELLSTKNLSEIIENNINTTYTSSCGRLFDAISAMLGVCVNPTYEGESAILLEASLYKGENIQNHIKDNSAYKPDTRYKIEFTKSVASKESTAHETSVLLMDPANMFKAVLDDIEQNVNTSTIALNVHNAFIEAITTCAQLINQLYGITQIALSGGCFMNRFLIENTIDQLSNLGFTVAINREVPCNDGGVSLGQAAVASNIFANSSSAN